MTQQRETNPPSRRLGAQPRNSPVVLRPLWSWSWRARLELLLLAPQALQKNCQKTLPPVSIRQPWVLAGCLAASSRKNKRHVPPGVIPVARAFWRARQRFRVCASSGEDVAAGRPSTRDDRIAISWTLHRRRTRRRERPATRQADHLSTRPRMPVRRLAVARLLRHCSATVPFPVATTQLRRVQPHSRTYSSFVLIPRTPSFSPRR